MEMWNLGYQIGVQIKTCSLSDTIFTCLNQDCGCLFIFFISLGPKTNHNTVAYGEFYESNYFSHNVKTHWQNNLKFQHDGISGLLNKIYRNEWG